MGTALLGFDLPGIKSYVFGSGRLREIRGGSACLDRLNRQVIPEEVRRAAPSSHLVFAGGGRGQFLVDSAELDHAEAAIRRAIRAYTDVHPRVASVPLDDREDVALSLLQARLRIAGGWPPPATIFVTHPLLLPCRSCGVRAASSRDPEPEGGERLLCAVCSRKVEMDRSIKQALANGQWPGLWKRLAEPPARDHLRGHDRPRDLQTLTGDEPLAVLYADGDEMGGLFGYVDSIVEFRRRSEVIDESLFDAVREAIAGPLRPLPSAQTLPFDVFLLGGDDLVIATTASRAFDTAKLIAERFHVTATNRLGVPVSLSIGIAIARSSYPVGVLVDIAEGALRYAKKTRRQRRAATGSASLPGFIAFAIIQSPGQTDFRTLAADWEPAGQAPRVRRSVGALDPRRLEQLVSLAASCGTSGTIARGKLQRLAEIGALPPSAARLEARLLYARCSEAERRFLKEALATLADGRQEDFPYIKECDPKQGDILITPWRDLAALAPLVRGGRLMRADRLALRYEIRLLGPLHVGSGLERGLVDRAVMRGPDGWPFIPGSAVKGLAREKCDQIAALLGLTVREPHNAGADVRQLLKGPTVVELLFGSRWRPGTISFSDAHPTGLGDRSERTLDWLLFDRTRVSISRRTGAARRQLLFTTEYVAPVLTFEGTVAGVVLWEPDDVFDDEHHPLIGLLLAGLLSVERVGGDRSVGAGHCSLRLLRLQLNDAVFEGDAVSTEVERLIDQLVFCELLDPGP
ncbi:MAG: hypothetical protein KatS3mg060_2881 [Dehalococcoidia bacterium]|nr:MAG: hypothetical protein KatS3mg060_2881 [Dehalococcoidia bacterium]